MAIGGGDSSKQPLLTNSDGEPLSMSNNEDAALRGVTSVQPPPNTLDLWVDVANGIDKSQTVVWKNAVNSLEEANRYLVTSVEARRFVEAYMRPVISILLEQQPSQIGQMEKNCVEESLRWAVMIIVEDLRLKADPSAGECTVLDVLSMIFNRKKIFYKGSKPNWNVNLVGMPEVRVHSITKFQANRGFSYLASYLEGRIATNQFPNTEFLHQILIAMVDILPTPNNIQDNIIAKNKMIEDEAIRLARAVMDYMGSASEESLKRQAHESLNTIRYDTQRIFEKLAPTHRKELYQFFEFWRYLTLKLINSKSLPLRLFGWEQVGEIIDACTDMRPPPQMYVVEGAGHDFVNGNYLYAGPLTEDGFYRAGAEISYVRKIPSTIAEKDGGGKTLTLFRCTMRSHHKWWFLSEADEEQPGTDKDIDYYQHKSKQHEEALPSSTGWGTCRGSIDPPPTLTPSGSMVPKGEEYNTLEHQLAKWAIQNFVIELVLGESVHREVVARSTPLIKFLALMCDRDDPVEHETFPTSSGLAPNAFCLKGSHLLLAWKTCTSKADAAVSAEVYQLLVSIIPYLPNDLAITLLSAVQDSLQSSNEKRDYLHEVAEFCAALPTINEINVDAGNVNMNNMAPPSISDEVRAEALKLVWKILIHPEASALKTYAKLKNFVTNELKVEPMGRKHRETFLRSCKDVLNNNVHKSSSPTQTNAIDEVLALRMVKLTQFLLEACPQDHAEILVTTDNASLPNLLFQDLTAYLKRRGSVSSTGMNKGKNNTTENADITSLSDRLYILRYVYGLSEQAEMTIDQLEKLWNLCTHHTDREALMIFIASASNVGSDSNVVDAVSAMDDPMGQPQVSTLSSHNSSDALGSSFSEKVCMSAFENLFCAPNLDWENLGEGAYQSFQILFKNTYSNTAKISSKSIALNALWGVCLHAGNDNVATQAMKDLLAVYTTVTRSPVSYSEAMSRTKVPDKVTKSSLELEDNFGRRVFECLVQVEKDLRSKKASSERSAERCLRILNAAVGHKNDDTHGGQVGSAVTSLSHINAKSNCAEILQSVQHGMRGQLSYRTISVTAKRVSPQQSSTVSNTGALVPAVSSNQSKMGKPPASEFFSIDVHPFETIASIKEKIALICNHPQHLVKPITVGGRKTSAGNRNSSVTGDAGKMNLNSNVNVFEDSTVAQLGIIDGCEVTVILAHNPFPANSLSTNSRMSTKKSGNRDLSELFSSNSPNGSADRFFDTLLAVLEALPANIKEKEFLGITKEIDTHNLVWDLLLAMPTNQRIIDRVLAATHRFNDSPLSGGVPDADSMVIETPRRDKEWSALINENSFYRSVYIIQAIDSFLQPASEILSNVPDTLSKPLRKRMAADALSFRTGFIESGGFEAVLRFFTMERNVMRKKRRTMMGNTVALSVLKCCFFGKNPVNSRIDDSIPTVDESALVMHMSLSDRKGLLQSLTSVVVEDKGVTDSAILNVIRLLRLLLLSNDKMTEIFATLPNNISEKFLMTLILWDFHGTLTERRVRRHTKELILTIPALAQVALPWLSRALDDIDLSSKGTNDFFSSLIKLVEGCGDGKIQGNATAKQLKGLASAVCGKLASHTKSIDNEQVNQYSSGVLSGCLELLRALIENGGGAAFKDCVPILTESINSENWANLVETQRKSGKNIVDMITSPFRSGLKSEDVALVNMMGAIFDGFLSSASNCSSTAICSSKESRQLGFHVLAAAARSTEGGEGYLALVSRLRSIISTAATSLRHKWSHNISTVDAHHRMQSQVSKYSGLRNQGCTCYMNSVLQQLFMMPALRKIICSATIPSSLRSSGSGTMATGAELVGKKISVHWESGVSYDASVKAFDASTGMHTICYAPLSIGTSGGQPNNIGGNMGHHHPQQQQIHTDDILSIPHDLPEEFFLSEGRPGKETGVFGVLPSDDMGSSGNEGRDLTVGESSREQPSIISPPSHSNVEETEDEISSRRLLEEVQRTFVHLEESSKGRCFDPRSLVEASGCLKLEFDVWQQNDASEFAMKLLDRLEVSLKKWAPKHFKFLEQTFGLKQTKQKICKECGLKTNREENLMNIDCQIRGKADIHEALSTMCEVEFMEGNNKVFCDKCEENTDTVLRTAISTLPDMLVLSLKRFDLDYNTFETVKLNSRCAFGQTLNMKRYTLEGLEEMENYGADEEAEDGDATMKPVEQILKAKSDEDYEYSLVGVLVHAGVAQGGHYYSFIKDRSTKGENGTWYRFDDEDVTAFDPASIELECFGGKVRQEKKFLNGQVQTVESEQFANALMLFYEKVKPDQILADDDTKIDEGDWPMDKNQRQLAMSSGYEAFQPDVRRSNQAHSWHTFLFDSEFQSFLKGLLGLCLVSHDSTVSSMDAMEVSSPSSTLTIDDTNSSWPTAILQVSLTYFFEILLHSADSKALGDWVKKLCAALEHDASGARWFVHELARRTSRVSANWLRIFCSDCPEEGSRSAAVKIIGRAMASCASYSDEQIALKAWIEAWTRQLNENQSGAIPTGLIGKYQMHEDVNGIDDNSASSIGIIISYISLLIEHAPRTWRYNSELCLLVSEISCIDPNLGGNLLRRALVEAQIPGRLMCLAIREKAPSMLKNAFQGASISHVVAEAIVRNETAPSSHLLNMDAGAVGMGTPSTHASNTTAVPFPSDHLNLLQSLGCLIGVPGGKRAVLVEDLDEISKGRPSIVLSSAVKEALSIIFEESKTSDAGMGQRDIENYMRRCGVDSNTVHPHSKITSILNKYPTITASTNESSKISRFLTLNGFLSYYRDTAQTNEAQVRSDLHTFGFRPDLSRRLTSYATVDSVAQDVGLIYKEKDPIKIGPYAESGLQSFALHSLAYSACEPLAECILATSAYGKDTNSLLVDTLKALSRAPTGWNGSETHNACLMVFKVLVSIQDDKQQERIQTMMQCREKCAPHADEGVGLLIAAKECSTARTTQYPVDLHYTQAAERYISFVKELRKLQKVNEWMGNNREAWAWMEHWFRSESLGPQQVRSDISGNRDGVGHPSSTPLNHHQHSNTEMNPIIGNDSESDDYGFDSVVVEGAGEKAVNGTYLLNGNCDGVGKCVKEGRWQGRDCKFSLFRCKLSDSTRRWYISIVPANHVPGTNKDTDFYSAQASGIEHERPPDQNWTTAKGHGIDPPPICICASDVSGEEEDDVDDNGRGWKLEWRNGKWE